MNHKPKILLLGDYSNCHRSLAEGLRRLNCDVTLASNGSGWMNCDRDIDISRKSGKLGGLELYMRARFGDLSRLLQGNDIVAIHDLNFLSLRPSRIKRFFDHIRRNNSSVFLTSMSTDIAYLDMLEEPSSPLRYSEWFVDGKPSRMHEDNPEKWNQWHDPELVEYQRYALTQLDGAVSVLYEYHLGMIKALGTNRVAYGGLPIDTQRFSPVYIPDRIGKIKLFLGRDRNRKLMKGSDLLEVAAKRVVERHPDKAELVIVENRPFNEFIELLKGAHVVLDQIYSYTPATTALMAMSLGLNVISGAEPQYYEFIGEGENRPIINAPLELESLTDVIGNIVLNPEQIATRGKRSREFVLKHNDSEVVAKRFLNFWMEKLHAKNVDA